MYVIKLFRIGQSGVSELSSTTNTIEDSIQTLFEWDLEPLLGVRFLDVFVMVDLASITLEPYFTHDVSNVDHCDTGDLEISLLKHEERERAQSLIKHSIWES